LFSYGRIGTIYLVTTPRQLNREIRVPPPFIAGRGGGVGGEDNTNVLETDPTVIDEMKSVSPLFGMVAPIGICYERYRDSSQNASHAPTRKQHFEGPEANLACSGQGHPDHKVQTTKQRYNTLCHQLGTITLLGT